MKNSKISIISPEAMGLINFIVFCALSIAGSIYLHFRVLNVADTDPFYHYTHAHLYAIHGPLYASFPWPTISVVSREPGDLWYGFHILLAPMAHAQSSVLWMKFAGAMVTASAIVLFGAALKLARIPFAYIWAFFLLMASGDEMARFMMLRPQELSAGLALIVIVAVLDRKILPAVVAAFLIVWMHITMVTLLALCVAAAYITGRILGRPMDRRMLGAIAIAALAGWLMRPHPWWTLRLLWVQLAELFAVKMSGVDLDWGTELYPMKASLFWSMYTPFVAAWLVVLTAAAIGVVRKWAVLKAEQSAFLVSTLALSLLFFVMIFVSASRSKDNWAFFTVAFMAAALAWIVLPRLEERARPICAALLAGVIVLMSAMSLPVNQKLLDENFSPYRFRDAGNWLRSHAAPGQIVFSSYWMYFSELLFWDPSNLYTGAADPIFEYSLDHRKYWEWESLNHQQYFDHVTDQPLTHPGPPIDLHTALCRDFHATYILAFRQYQPRLLSYLQTDRRFKLEYYDGGLGIFRVL